MNQFKSIYGRRYPNQLSDFVELEYLLDEQLFSCFAPDVPILKASDQVVTIGSCFAMNVAESLQELGMKVLTLRFHEEANSPLANLLLLDYLVNREASPAREMFEGTVPLSKADDLLEPIRSARCLIFTVGVGITCFDKRTGSLVLRPNNANVDDIVWDFPTPEVSAAHLRGIIALVKSINPGIHVVLTLSPIPLYRAITTGSAFVEDCVSKSHLRVALHNVFKDEGTENVYYWPSFEAFRWVGGHTGPVYGQDDGNPRHASKEMVGMVARTFAKYFAEPHVPGALPSTGTRDELRLI